MMDLGASLNWIKVGRVEIVECLMNHIGSTLVGYADQTNARIFVKVHLVESVVTVEGFEQERYKVRATPR